MPPNPSNRRGAGVTVLVLDDDAAILRTISRTLSLHAYEVLQAQTVHAALRIMEEHPDPIHVILCDLVLPSLGGREAANALLARRPDARVLYMSGYSNRDRRAVQLGDEAFLGKPFEISELLGAIEALLDERTEE